MSGAVEAENARAVGADHPLGADGDDRGDPVVQIRVEHLRLIGDEPVVREDQEEALLLRRVANRTARTGAQLQCCWVFFSWLNGNHIELLLVCRPFDSTATPAAPIRLFERNSPSRGDLGLVQK